MVEEKAKRDKWERECQIKREEWYRLEGNYNRWEGELNGRERDLREWEGNLIEMERELRDREGEIRRDFDREYKVCNSELFIK